MGAVGALVGIQAAAGIYGAYQQSQAQKEQGRMEQALYEQNARYAELQAENASARGGREAVISRGKGSRIRGSQRAGFAGQGVDVDVGTPSAIQQETDSLSELDALTITNNAWREAWGYRAEASNLRTQGKFARLGAKNQARNTLITGGLQFASDLTKGAYLYGQSGNSVPAKKGYRPGGYDFA